MQTKHYNIIRRY